MSVHLQLLGVPIASDFNLNELPPVQFMESFGVEEQGVHFHPEGAQNIGGSTINNLLSVLVVVGNLVEDRDENDHLV